MSKMTDTGGIKDKPGDREPGPENRPDLSPDVLESIFTGAPIGVYIVQDGVFRFANPAFQKISGYREDELLGMGPLNIVHPEDRDLVRGNAVKMLKGEPSSTYVYRVVNKTGETRWIIESVASVHYQEKRATLGYFMDNTSREQVKESLRLSEERFYKAFLSSPDWVVISAIEDGFYVDVNDAFLRITGYRREEVIGRTSLELRIWADPGQRAGMVKILREQGAVRNMEVKFRMKSGDIRFMLWSAEVIDFGGEKCLIAVSRDITDHKRAEEERLERERRKGPATLVTQLGLSMVASILICFAIGYYLDKWLGTKGLFIIILILLGVAGGGYNAYRQIMETTRRDKNDKTHDG
jgi:PAS domain S-box-containing protein